MPDDKMNMVDKMYRETWGRYYLPILRFCCVKMKREGIEAAEDCVQETFLEYWRAISQNRSIQTPQAWLYKTAISKIIAYKKHNKLVPVSFEEYEPVENIDYIEEIIKGSYSDDQLLEKVLMQLPTEERSLFERIYIQKQSSEELAAKMGISLNTFYQRKWRLRKTIKTILRDVLQGAISGLTKKNEK